MGTVPRSPKAAIPLLSHPRNSATSDRSTSLTLAVEEHVDSDDEYDSSRRVFEDEQQLLQGDNVFNSERDPFEKLMVPPTFTFTG